MTAAQQIESLLRKALFTYELIPENEGILVALSGGKDSLTLLHLLHSINGRGVPRFKLHAAHVSGAFTCGAGVDISFLHEICNKLDVPLEILQSHQELETLECYSCSRERRKLLFDSAKRNQCGTVAFGHHRDDHIQTLLMNLLHKGEFAGNLAKVPMIKYGITIIRPMIYVSEALIVGYAQEKGFLRALCRCPVGQRSLRKKTEELLKQLEEVFPHARTNLARAGWEQGSEGALVP